MVLAPFTAATAAGVDINSADAATLARELAGVGDVKAQAIVEYREQHGPFKSADDLINVDGIGAVTVEKNRDLIIIAASAETDDAATAEAGATPEEASAAPDDASAATEETVDSSAATEEKAKENSPAAKPKSKSAGQ